MKLWRLDAQHELDGAFSELFGTPQMARNRALNLAYTGWLVDVYEVEVGEISWVTRSRLCAQPWPTIDTEAIVQAELDGSLVTCDQWPADQERQEDRGQENETFHLPVADFPVTQMQTARERLAKIVALATAGED